MFIIFQIKDYAISDIICEQCVDKTIQSFIFIENARNLFAVLNSCVNDLLSKVTDLNNELNENHEDANVMIVIEHDNEINEYVNETDHSFKKLLSYVVEPDMKKVIIDSKSWNSNPQTKENYGPVIQPIRRIIKHPRIKESVIKKAKPSVEVDTPTISLANGKLVIAPLAITAQSAPNYNTYSCNSCTSIFTTYRSFKEHEKTFHNTTIYQCRFCSKKYNSQQYLDVHYVNSHGKSRCRHCQDLFNVKELNDHLREKHEKQVNICKFCSLVYYSAEQLETHIKSTHLSVTFQLNNNKTQCIMCLRNFKDVEMKMHKCKFSCLECSVMPCLHYSYLMSYREQILSHATKIRCLDCDFTTKRKEQLITHVNREHLDHHPFTCNDCGTQFYTKLSLRTHIEQFHQDLKCQYCDHEFKNSKLLYQHRKLCKGIARTYSCKLCVASFNTSTELERHTSVSHSNIVYPCTLCKKEFTNELSLQSHHAKVHSGIQYKKRRKFIECTLCDITFNNVKEMLLHEEQLHDSNVTFPCKVCTKRFTSLKKMYIHKQKHYSHRKKCHSCNKQVVASYYAQHTAICSKFKNWLPHSCEICDKSFHTPSALQSHKQLHEQPTPCQYCDKLVKPASMKNHIKIKHSDMATCKSTIYKCEQCNYGSKKRHEYENHVNKVHLKVKPFICQICKKSFCGKARLDEHLRTHSDDSNCFCIYCNKKFANKVCLKMHTRRHTGEKPYECNICFERFRSSSIMKTHRLKKHQDKTIQCPLCDSMYHLAAEMRFHVKKVHWKRPEPFDFRQIVAEEYHHLFEDRRLQKLGEV